MQRVWVQFLVEKLRSHMPEGQNNQNLKQRQSILKEISPEYSLKGLMLKLKLQYFGHLMWRANSLEKTLMLWKIECRRRRGKRMRWLDGIINLMDMNLSKLWEIVKDGEALHAAVQEVAKSQTRQSNGTAAPFIYLDVLDLSCGMQDLAPWPVIRPWPPALGAWSLSHWTTRESIPSGFLFMGVTEWHHMEGPVLLKEDDIIPCSATWGPPGFGPEPEAGLSEET